MGDRTDMSMVVESVMVGDSTVENPTELHYLLPRLLDRQYAELPARVRGLTYITAERTGPRDVYPLKDKQAARVVGPAGEHTASVLYLRGDDSVPVGLALPNIPQTLLRQVEERMRTFFPGCGMIVQRVPQSNSVTLGLRTSTDTDFHRPIHVGFGLTQVLPIVVAALSSSPGDILLIENPEVHLHPAGQAAMGIFLAEVANAGIQVIVESHSDHVLNGIRRFVKCGGISRDAISLHFFRPRILRGSQVLSPQMDATGNIDVWPDGFFDQFDKDINYFAGWGEGHETTSE
jgi:predicted ATPase